MLANKAVISIKNVINDEIYQFIRANNDNNYRGLFPSERGIV
jgi:hypothetical protein